MKQRAGAAHVRRKFSGHAVSLGAPAAPLDEIPGFLLLPAASGLIELAEAVDDRDRLETAYRALAPYAELFCCGGAGVIATTGSTHGPLGVAAAALGRVDDGVTRGGT